MRRQLLVDDSLQSCPYLPGRVARMPLYRQFERLGLVEADEAFSLGERRVGRSLYTTACPTCQECRPLRVLTREFELSKSQRRVLSRWDERGRVEIGPPVCTDEKLALYNRHKFGRSLAASDDEPMEVLGYTSWLVESCFHTMEMRYFWMDRLIGVGIVDLGATSASSVYFYFDPDLEISRLSPGVFSTLQEIHFCRQTGREHLYLGLYVRDCSHLSYKAGYCPHERWADGDWRRVDR